MKWDPELAVRVDSLNDHDRYKHKRPCIYIQYIVDEQGLGLDFEQRSRLGKSIRRYCSDGLGRVRSRGRQQAIS